MKRRSFFPGLLIALLFAIPVLSQSKPKMEDVAGKLACYCGTCPHLVVTKCGCGTAEQIKKDVQAQIDKGMTEQQILDSYVAQYGQTVLAAPTRSGFNLTAWVLPFAAFAFGGFVLYRFLRRQQRAAASEREAMQAESKPASKEESAYREELERELEMRR